MSIDFQFDVLIIGSGAAGLMSAIQLSEKLSVGVIAKDKILEGSSYYAQGGISAVLNPDDSFESHITDTMNTGFHLGNKNSIRFMVEQAPKAIKDLEKAGFDVEHVKHSSEPNDENRDYLKTKASKMNHRLDVNN